MAVYVDDWRQRARLGTVESRWSHLIGDDEEELHAFAEALGMRRAWYQWEAHRPHRAHYDLPDHLRDAAIAAGAHAVSWRTLGAMIRDRRRAAALDAAG